MTGSRSGLLLVAVAALLSFGAHSVTAVPYIRLGQILRNNSVIDLSFVGLSNVIECVTDLNTCCSEAEGVAERAWYLPNGTKLIQDGGHEIESFQVQAGAQQLDLVLNDHTARSDPTLSGIYECSIDTNSEPRQSVFVGLYYQPMADIIEVEEIFFSGGSVLPSTITCITVNRPASVVEWHLNREEMTDVESTTVLSDPVTSRYTHTLSLNMRQGGEYECFVTTFDDHTNHPPVLASALLNIEVGSPPQNVQAHKVGPDTVHVFWTLPDPLLETAGYAVSYSGPTSGVISVAGGDTDNVMVTGLVNGQSYQFSVAGISSHFESESVSAAQSPITLFPSAPELTLSSVTADSMSVTWTVPSGSVVERFELEWKVLGEQQLIVTLSDALSGTTDGYSITGLAEYDNMTVEVKVAAVNAAGTNSSVPLTLHSDILQRRPTPRDCENEDNSCSSSTSTISFGAIIGGAVGIFLIGLLLGNKIVIIIYGLTQNCRKKRKYSAANAAYQPSARQMSMSYGQSVHTTEPVTQTSLALTNNSDPVTAHNVAYQSDVAYEYIS